MYKAVLAGLAATALLAQAAPAGATLYTGSGTVGGNSVAASANITLAGSQLSIVLSNTSPANSLESPTSTLTGLSFQIKNSQQSSGFTPFSASASSIFQANLCDAGTCTGSNVNVGGEWGYQYLGGSATNVIGSAGYVSTGLAGNLGNFNGPNLDDPKSLDGINFGVISAAHGPLNGGLAEPLVLSPLTLLLNGFSFQVSDITNLHFLYGTSVADLGSIPGDCTPQPSCGGGGGPPPPIPEPATLFLLGSALLGYGAYRRRQRS